MGIANPSKAEEMWWKTGEKSKDFCSTSKGKVKAPPFSSQSGEQL